MAVVGVTNALVCYARVLLLNQIKLLHMRRGSTCTAIGVIWRHGQSGCVWGIAAEKLSNKLKCERSSMCLPLAYGMKLYEAQPNSGMSWRRLEDLPSFKWTHLLRNFVLMQKWQTYSSFGINEIIKIIYWYWFRWVETMEFPQYFLMHSNEWTVCVWNIATTCLWGRASGRVPGMRTIVPDDIKFQMVLLNFIVTWLPCYRWLDAMGASVITCGQNGWLVVARRTTEELRFSQFVVWYNHYVNM